AAGLDRLASRAGSGIGLPDEPPGILRDGRSGARIDVLTHTFGQGVSVTPVQMVAAYATIANGGTLMPPFLVRRIIAANGEVSLEREPEGLRRVSSPRTAGGTTGLLRRGVEEEGWGGPAAPVGDLPVVGPH